MNAKRTVLSLCRDFNIVKIETDFKLEDCNPDEGVYVIVFLEKDTKKSDAVIGVSATNEDSAKDMAIKAYAENILPKWGGSIPTGDIAESSIMFCYYMKAYSFMRVCDIAVSI